MKTITIPKIEYERLEKCREAYLRLAEEITKAPWAYPYDYPYIDKLVLQARGDYKKGKLIEARSVDEAMAKFKNK